MEWLGQLPQNWKVMPLWTLLCPRIHKNTEGQERNLLSLSYGRIIRKDIETKTGLLPASFNGYNIIEAGDIVLRLTDLQNDMRSLRSGLAKEHGIITSAYLSLKPTKDNQDTRYYHYLLNSFDLIKGFYNMGEGIRQNLNYDELSRLKLPFPPLDEQSRIASFLDSHIAKIDDSIARYKALSDKLDEYRKAIITKAVTQGIRGERPMKESRVSWIECIPEDWDNSRLKALFRFGKGLSITKENLVESGYPVISYGQIHAKYNNGVSVDERLIRFVDEDHISESSVVGKNDMIFADTSEDLEGCGNCVYIDTDSPIYGGYHTIILRSNTDKSNKYIAYLCKTDMWRCQIRNLLTDVKLFSISQKVLKNTTIILPPEDEQAEIVAYLDKKCSDIEKSKAKIETVIKKLEEYKKSLIYNAVTGKIEC